VFPTFCFDGLLAAADILIGMVLVCTKEVFHWLLEIEGGF